jgi:hypothetical protein
VGIRKRKLFLFTTLAKIHLQYKTEICLSVQGTEVLWDPVFSYSLKECGN